MPTHLAVDIGTSGTTVMSGSAGNGPLEVELIEQFDRPTTRSEGRQVWDLSLIREQIEQALGRAAADHGTVSSIGIDTPATDLGVVSGGGVHGNPYFYRDSLLRDRTAEITDEISRRELFELTGSTRTPNAYFTICRESMSVVQEAEAVVPLPQLLGVLIGGRVRTEPTIASTTGMFDLRTQTWAEPVLERLGLPVAPLAEVGQVGEPLGTVASELRPRGHDEIDLTMIAGHDTGSAVAALPMSTRGSAFLCTGSWLVPGLELADPVTSGDAFRIGATNEAGVGGTVRFVRNLPGFALLEDCRAQWRESGGRYRYDELLAGARSEDTIGPLIDPGDPLFYDGMMAGSIPQKIARFCRQTGQQPPSDEVATTRCLIASLAIRSVIALQNLTDVTGDPLERIYLCGGGQRNPQFCRTVAAAADNPVWGGPTEATAVGNLLVQMEAAGRIDSLADGRRLVERSMPFDRYDPADGPALDGALDRMRSLIQGPE